MVSEVRRLAFSREEIIQAVAQFSGPAKIDLPLGHVIDAKVTPTGVVLAIEQLGARSVIRREISMAEMASLLLRYCIHLKIPMPRHSAKSLAAKDGGIVFEIKMTTAPLGLARPS
jgi:hypothetical protein